MTTYKCNIDSETFGKVSGVKRHQTRKHPGVADLAVIEIQDDGTEVLVEEVAKPVAKRVRAASKPAKAARAAKPRAKKEQAAPEEIRVTVHSDNTVTINRDLFDTLMRIAGAPLK
ncbi:hypothetical protein [Ferrimicrobium acidiphilum]|jgi:hypothetical protein|uniref:hypothetical protein n=1 Tax=Ferrimicrobium acidiphilum TaxID=121039 RepID=UPI0023F375C2|nr:hypothetical protein [Ferrimicrobium acidiphilum]